MMTIIAGTTVREIVIPIDGKEPVVIDEDTVALLVTSSGVLAHRKMSEDTKLEIVSKAVGQVKAEDGNIKTLRQIAEFAILKLDLQAKELSFFIPGLDDRNYFRSLCLYRARERKHRKGM